MSDTFLTNSATQWSSCTRTSWRTPIWSPRTFSSSTRITQRRSTRERWDCESFKAADSCRNIIVESWNSTGEEHRHPLDRFWQRNVRPRTSQHDRLNASLSITWSHLGARLGSALWCLVDRLYHVRALLGNHALSNARQSRAPGYDGENSWHHALQDGEVLKYFYMLRVTA